MNVLMWIVVRLLCKMWLWNFIVSLRWLWWWLWWCLMMIMLMFDDDYDDDFNDDDLLMVMNSYMQNDDDIDDDRMYEKWRCWWWWFVGWAYALLSHMFMHHKCQVGYLYPEKMFRILSYPHFGPKNAHSISFTIF